MLNEKLIKEIASWRISRLFELAEISTEKNKGETPVLARKYVALARKISTHYKVKMPPDIKNRICKGCNSVMVPGFNCKVRIASNGFLIYLCNCGLQKKIHLNKETNRKAH